MTNVSGGFAEETFRAWQKTCVRANFSPSGKVLLFVRKTVLKN